MRRDTPGAINLALHSNTLILGNYTSVYIEMCHSKCFAACMLLLALSLTTISGARVFSAAHATRCPLLSLGVQARHVNEN
jgi:hypothetical protein